MEGLFWGCLIVGVLYAVVSVIFGDWIGQAMDGALDFLSLDGHDWFQPMTLIGGVTAFGGAGLLLTQYTALGQGAVIILALVIAVAAGGGVYFLYVRPMEQSENSVAFSVHDLVGKLAEVSVSIPPSGFGEVLVQSGTGNTNQIAASFDGEQIEGGARVVVVEVKDSALYVSRLDVL
ncbi:protease [Paenibacillus sp. NPDC058071]|uniref:protease n=1 Tax=Paenibacillus sp. NPDC058071 TaxID=3346326 RepID=UPI0036DC603D